MKYIVTIIFIFSFTLMFGQGIEPFQFQGSQYPGGFIRAGYVKVWDSVLEDSVYLYGHADSTFLTELGGGGVNGLGQANKVAYWSASDTLTYDTSFHWITASKWLGIGTNSPGSNLHIHGGTFPDIRITNLTTGLSGGARIYQFNDTLYIANTEPGSIELGTNNVTRVKITSTGDVNIPNLASGGSPPSTSGTLVKVVSDTNGKLSYQTNNTGTVTSVGAVTGTAGTDFNISGSPITGSGNITYNLPIASASNTGKLLNTDWTLFNSKPNGSGAANKVAYWSSASELTSNNNFHWDNINERFGVGTSSPGYKMHIAAGTDLTSFLTSHSGVNGGFSIQNTGTLGSGRDAQIRLVNGTTVFGANDRTYQMINIGTSTTASDYVLQYYNGSTYSERFRITSGGLMGINTPSPSQVLDVNGNARFRSGIYDGSNSLGTSGQVLSTTGSSTQWVTAPTGSGTTNTLPIWTGSTSLGDSKIIHSGNNVVANLGSSSGAILSARGTNYPGLNCTHPTWPLVNNVSQSQITLTNGSSYFSSNDNSVQIANAYRGGTPQSEFFYQRWNGTNYKTFYQYFFTDDYTNFPGEVRFQDRTGTAANVTGFNSNGKVVNVTIGTGLSLSGGTLSSTGVTGSGTAGYVTHFTGSTSVGSTNVYYNVNGFGFNTTSPLFALHLNNRSIYMQGTSNIIDKDNSGGCDGCLFSGTGGSGMKWRSPTNGLTTDATTISLTGQALALHNLGSNGLMVRRGLANIAAVSIEPNTGAGEFGIKVINGNGASGNPSISLLSNYATLTGTNDQTLSTTYTKYDFSAGSNGEDTGLTVDVVNDEIDINTTGLYEASFSTNCKSNTSGHILAVDVRSVSGGTSLLGEVQHYFNNINEFCHNNSLGVFSMTAGNSVSLYVKTNAGSPNINGCRVKLMVKRVD